MTKNDFFNILQDLKEGCKIKIKIKKDENTFFEKEKEATLTYEEWDYDDDEPTVLNIYFKEGYIFELSQLESIEIIGAVLK